mmetsp:Transcript_17521/g.39717  ORF Transcript_17521/g.39717 Transcript_17521/m.39717 type:complete len:384 (+) Transcript_17521:65-1216(+)
MGKVLGKSISSLPPITERDLGILLALHVQERHIVKMWKKFREVDVHCNGVWTVAELYQVINEPRLSMRAPIIEQVFFMADAISEGGLGFVDFLVTMVCFCALTKEEVLQLFFMIVDQDRNGYVDKEEFLDFFSYVPVGCGNNSQPVFPVNNKNALDKFKQGKWEALSFDGLAQLCERFPYISYPAFHVQDLFRDVLLGRSFWERLELKRGKITSSTPAKARMVTLPGSRQKIEVKLPGRVTMQELLEYSRRKTSVHAGRRVMKDVDMDAEQYSSSTTKERDKHISKCPLMCMIRNPRCMYYVPDIPTEALAKKYRAARPPDKQMEFELAPEGGLAGAAVEGGIPLTGLQNTGNEEDDESSSGSYESTDASDEEEDEEEEPAKR